MGRDAGLRVRPLLSSAPRPGRACGCCAHLSPDAHTVRKLTGCHRLNVCVPPNSQVEILIPNTRR